MAEKRKKAMIVSVGGTSAPIIYSLNHSKEGTLVLKQLVRGKR